MHMHYPFTFLFLFLSSSILSFTHATAEDRKDDDYEDDWELNKCTDIGFDKFLSEILMKERDFDVFAMLVGSRRICTLCKYVAFTYILKFVKTLL